MDAAEIISKNEKVCVFMEHGISYADASGLKFTRENPFQIMFYIDAQRLISNNHNRFRIASKEEVESFYRLDRK
jgi:hypothetical protein